MVDLSSAGDCIRSNPNPDALGQQVEGGLGNTDVGFESAEYGCFGGIAELSGERVATAATERQLCRGAIESLHQWRNGWPKALRVLLGREHRDVEKPGGINKPAGLGDDG